MFLIAGLVEAELNKTGKTKDDKISELESADKEFKPLKALSDRHHPYVVEIIAEYTSVEVEDVIDFEIVLYDTQKACLRGINNELIFSTRLDNLSITYHAIEGLIESVSSPSALEDKSSIRLITCFDHKEIRSTTAHGVVSNLLPAVLCRLSVLLAHHDALSDNSYDKIREADLDIATAYEQTLSTSFLVSADMVHSINPNYTYKYESDHLPEMNKGTVIKVNTNQRYATNSPGIVPLQEVARRAKPSQDTLTSTGVPLQLFVVRNDSSCGSTIGPMLSAALRIRTIDVGNAQLSMHSIRETGGDYDIEHRIRPFESFFDHFTELESKILVD